MAPKVWWCETCGYEVTGRGRCHGCGAPLLPSLLPSLEPGQPGAEVGYRINGWDGATRGALIQALIDLGVRHRFEDEDEELVVSATDETRADDAMRRALAEQPQRRRKDFSGTAPGQDWGHEKGWEPPVWPPPPPFAPSALPRGPGRSPFRSLPGEGGDAVVGRPVLRGLGLRPRCPRLPRIHGPPTERHVPKRFRGSSADFQHTGGARLPERPRRDDGGQRGCCRGPRPAPTWGVAQVRLGA